METISEAYFQFLIFSNLIILFQIIFIFSSIHQVLSRLICEGDVAAAFHNLSKLASILSVLPVTTATVERTFSSMKLIKTRLRKRMGDGTLDSTM